MYIWKVINYVIFPTRNAPATLALALSNGEVTFLQLDANTVRMHYPLIYVYSVYAYW